MSFYEVNYMIRDRKGETSRLHFYLIAQEEWHDLTGFVQGYARWIDEYIGGAIIKISVSLNIALPTGIKTIPEADSDVEETALFTFRTDNGFPVRVSFPTFKEEFIDDEGNVQGAGGIVYPLQTGEILEDDVLTDMYVHHSSSRGEIVTHTESAKQKFKKSR